MKFPTCNLALSLIGFLVLPTIKINLVNSSPVENHDLLPRQSQETVCTDDKGAFFDESCWKTLDLTNWLKDWTKKKPRCAGQSNGLNCCPEGEPWSTCFTRLSTGDAGYNCTAINTQSCQLEMFTVNGSVTDRAQTRYILRNIYGRHNR